MIPLAGSRQPAGAASRQGSRELRWAIGTWSACVLYHATFFDRRWIPHDEGTLGQAAWRVLKGQVPHRDFDGMYTGLLDYVHAGAMSMVGVHLLTPRLVMLLAVMLWLPAVWAIARRLTGSPLSASAATVLALVAGPPNYPAAMPSWYNLFFATWGLWALLRWTHRERSGWLLLAGVMAGLSILFKVTGLYLLAGVLFYVLHVEATRAPRGIERSPPSLLRPFPLLAAAVVTLLVLLQIALVWRQIGVATWVSYVLPTVLLGTVIVVRAREVEDGGAALRATISRWTWTVGGTLLPIVPFLAWYASSGSLGDLYRGVFVLPAERLTDVALPVPGFGRTWTILVPAALVLLGAAMGRRLRLVTAGAILTMIVALMVRIDARIFIGIFDSMVLVVPLVAAAGAWLHFRSGPDTRSDLEPLFATLWVLAMVHLIRYPFAIPLYFMYVAPLAVLAVSGVVVRMKARDTGSFHPLAPRRSVLAAVMLAYGIFFVAGANRGGLFSPLPPLQLATLPLERGRISVPIAEAAQYSELVDVVRDLTRSPYVYAGPDASEVSFLAGLENPTRSLFEIFEDDELRTERTLDALARHDVNVVVINTRPRFSSMPADLVAALTAAYPNEVRVGRFVVRWKPAEW